MQGMTRREREITDMEKIIAVLDGGKFLHLGLCDGNEPYVVPMNYGYEIIDGKIVVYLHGAKRGKKIDIIKKNPNVFFTMECDCAPFDGEVACKYGMAYSCFMGKGTAEIIEDMNEKKHAMSVLMKTQTGKDFVFDERTVDVVSVIKINVHEYTAKGRPMPER